LLLCASVDREIGYAEKILTIKLSDIYE